MADSLYHFRSALGGFHKGDVTGYIEKTAAQHRSEMLELEATIVALRDENRSLQQQLSLLMMATPAPVAALAPIPVPEPVVAPAPVVAPEPVAAPVAMNTAELVTAELQAYRRAESVERNAAQRARNLYHQMENVCEDALDKFQSTDSTVKQTLELMLEQANTLEQAYQALSAALNGSREKLATMNELLYIETPEE